jgi:hypothetical protein
MKALKNTILASADTNRNTSENRNSGVKQKAIATSYFNADFTPNQHI